MLDPRQAMDYDGEISGLKRAMDQTERTLIVMSEIQAKQAEVQPTQAERVAAQEARFEHIERALAEAGDKLNALITVLDGVIRKRPPLAGEQ